MTAPTAVHMHRCMRCGEEFECRSPNECAAQYDVLPTIITRGPDGRPVVTAHCPAPAPGPAEGAARSASAPDATPLARSLAAASDCMLREGYDEVLSNREHVRRTGLNVEMLPEIEATIAAYRYEMARRWFVQDSRWSYDR